ncbi:hypothetical protein [Nonomuraea bangladeshensis]|uniref:hypothetical protein n=1 Tax=Nonomuraea bangladeshensis TaxID=404385 RepID=UPI0031E3111C
MTIVNEQPVALRGADLFWHVMSTFILQQANTNPCSPVLPGEVRWDQGTWRDFVGKDRCGTAFCLAGYISDVCGGRWLVTLDEHGGLLVDGKPPRGSVLGAMDLLLAEPDDILTSVRDGITVTSAHNRAVRLLGLDGSYDLFAETNTYDDLVLLGTDLFGPPPAHIRI